MAGRPRNIGKSNSTHSIRVDDQVWEAARRRATYDGTTISTVMADLAEGYAKGLVDAPRITKQFVPTRKETA